MYTIPTTRNIKDLFDDLKLMASTVKRRGLKPSSFNHIGKYGELIMCEFLDASLATGQGGVDIILPNRKTAQVKTTHFERDEITCTYEGTEPIDLIFILDLNIEASKATILYGGPFKEFVLEVNSRTKRRGWDNHITPKKKLIHELQGRFGLAEYDTLRNSEFFEYSYKR